MKLTARRTGVVASCLIAGMVVVCWNAQTRAFGPARSKISAAHFFPPITTPASTWDQAAAAAYLDQRASWWMDWPKAARDHETFCISCHTAVPYVLSRPALRHALAEESPSANERRLLDNVTKRVRLWDQVAPFYSDADRGAYKTAESRGTESVLNALVLATNDAQGGKLSQLSDDTRTALHNMWAEQQTAGDNAGGWSWLRFHNEPWEADDSDFYGATLAAVAAGTAPQRYIANPEIENNLKLLRVYFNRHSAAQTAVNRAALLWASAKVPALLDEGQRRAITSELLAKQRSDGGWSLASLVGAWKRADGTPQEVKSDGYATGFITFVLQQAGLPREHPQVQRGLAWLAANQSKPEGFWLSYSLNKNGAHHISPGTARFMNDAATAYAILALTTPAQH